MVTWGNNTTATFGKGTSAAASTTPAPAAGFSFGGAPATATQQHPSTPPTASQPAPSLNPPPIIGTSNTAAPATGGGLFGSNPGMLQLICVLWGICYSIYYVSQKCTSCVHFFVFATALCINSSCTCYYWFIRCTW